MQILIKPQTVLIDEKVDIRLTGLIPNQLVTLRAKMNEMPGAVYEAESYATYLVDGSGEIKLDRDAPISGSYSGVDSMGLFWSMEIKKIGYNMTRKLDELIFEPKSSEIALTVEIDDKIVGQAILHRNFVSSDVEILDVMESGIVGKYFSPKMPGPAPGIIVLGGGEGGLGSQMNYAALLASNGFPTLALAYFKFEHLPEQLQEIPLEYFQSAIDWLQKRDEVDANKIGLFGRSKGAELSLILGGTYSQIKAVVASSPSSTVCIGNFKQVTEYEFETYSSWSYQGSPLPYVKWTNEQCLEAHWKLKNGIRIDGIHKTSLEQCDKLGDVAIPIENIAGPIMIITSSDDHWWPSGIYGEKIKDRLVENKFPHHFEHLHYGDTGHMIRYPYIPTTQLKMNGGTAENNAHASSDSWTRIKQFFKKSLLS